MPRVGVLALQGDVREHVSMLEGIGCDVVRVRHVGELDDLSGLVLPGGESTTIARLLVTSGMKDELGARIAQGLNVLGTCAGLILLAREVLDGREDQWSFGAIDVGVRRNGYGRQMASFEAPIDVAHVGTVAGVFIRAPRIESWSPEVSVLATHDHGDGEHPVLVRQRHVWGVSFHPELTSDDRVHRLFVDSL